MIQTIIQEIKEELPEHVRLIAVSKFHPVTAIQEAYDGGQRIFGESKVQEMTQKYEALPKDIEWHFIGHLQTNKIKYIVPYVALIHGVDSYKLLAEIDKQAKPSPPPEYLPYTPDKDYIAYRIANRILHRLSIPHHSLRT